MKQIRADNTRENIDEFNKRCIWMTAGVISYKLCPSQFDCEKCEFDAAMRQKQGPTDPPESDPPITNPA